MAEPVRWVTRAEAVREMRLSVSTLDRMIRRGEIEVRREGRRVYVRMEGPEYVSNEELLRRALAREDKLQRTARDLDGRASELERERDEARNEVARWERGYDELEEEYSEERAAHGRTRWLALRLGLVAAALLVYSVLFTWLLLT